LFFSIVLIIHPLLSAQEKVILNILNTETIQHFEDNNQNYFIGFSNKINNEYCSGLVYLSQWSGICSGVLGFNA